MEKSRRRAKSIPTPGARLIAVGLPRPGTEHWGCSDCPLMSVIVAHWRDRRRAARRQLRCSVNRGATRPIIRRIGIEQHGVSVSAPSLL
jgi:hypothetical protein